MLRTRIGDLFGVESPIISAGMGGVAGADLAAAVSEAGGHVRGQVMTLALVPEIRDALIDLPLIAAGGIADRRGLVAAIALGADAAAFGTRFLASVEAAAHPLYKGRILNAHASDTVHTTLFGIGWPDAPHRVLRTAVVNEWEHAGRPAPGKRPGKGQTIVRMRRADVEVPLLNYTVMPPAAYVEGGIERLAFYAGQSCSLVNEILPAGEIVRRIAAEAARVISNRLGPLVH